MFEGFKALAERSAMERAVLVVNHVVAAEPAAVERLKPHAGRTMTLVFAGWPALLPPLGPFVLRVTAAGLVECVETPADAASDLRAAIDVANPALVALQLLSGDRPAIEITGDAAFASDLHWLVENVRWDAEGDLAKIVGDAPAREIARVGGWLAKALRDAVRNLRDLAGRGAGKGAGPAGANGAPPPA